MSELAKQLERREAIFDLEDQLLNKDENFVKVDLEVEHFFADGLYGRLLHIPKGVVLTGAIHKYSTINILLSGEISLFTERDETLRVKAPFVVVSKPGIKKVGLAHEDCMFLTVNKNETNETDVAKVEELLFTNDYSELPEATMKQLTGGNL